MPTMRPRLAYTPLRQSVLRDLLTPRIPPMPQTGAEAHVLEALDRMLGKPVSGAKVAADDDAEGEGGVLEVRWLDPRKQ